MSRRKPIDRQVVVITGASSGIGLATARIAAHRGARVVLTSFDAAGLDRVTSILRTRGSEVRGIPADVSDYEALERVARSALEDYGRIDAWINNAGVHVFGRVLETDDRDRRRIFDVNYWGTVYGSHIAIPHLRRSEGVLVNMASVLAARSIPLQGFYTASKHAVKAYTDALRVELEADRVPVVVTLIMPSAIHTPIVEHSKSYLAGRAQLPPPYYDPYVAARAVVEALERPRREVIVGGTGKVAVLAEKLAPRLTDAIMKKVLIPLQTEAGPPRSTNALHTPEASRSETHAAEPRFMFRRSTYTWAEFHPLLAGTTLLFGLAAVTAWYRWRSKRRGSG